MALGALFLALNQVREIAEQGRIDNRDLATCLRGLLGHYEHDVETLYGEAGCLDEGLRLLADHLAQPRNMQLTRYLVSVLQLERKLRRDRARLAEVGNGLERARGQMDYFGDAIHPSVIASVAQTYKDRISPLRPRIIVQGHGRHLEDERHAAAIRALLLAAIRSAGLWQVNGGGRLRLIFGRPRIIEAARRALSQVPSA
jgi:high frequency lysogenization protein